MKITSIKQKARSKNIFSVYVDDEFWANMLDESIVLFGIQTGREFSKKQLDDAFLESRTPLAFHIALNALEHSFKTSKQISLRLKEEGFNSFTIGACLEKLSNYGYIDDEKYAKLYVLRHPQKGKKALRFDLSTRGVPDDIASKVLSKVGSQIDTITTLAQKFLSKPSNASAPKQKLFRHLASKGFDFEDINRVLDKVYKGETNESWD